MVSDERKGTASAVPFHRESKIGFQLCRLSIGNVILRSEGAALLLSRRKQVLYFVQDDSFNERCIPHAGPQNAGYSFAGRFTRFSTCFTVRRYANIAFKSSSFMCLYPPQGIIGFSWRSITDPVRMAWMNRFSL